MTAPTRDLGRLADAKGARLVSVAIPARNEQSTIGGIVEPIRRELMGEQPIVDELLVIDHASTDATARVARSAGARVVPGRGVAPEWGPALGKGDVLWRSVIATRGDIIVWIDADLEQFASDIVVRLAAPLILDPGIAMVRPDYGRALDGMPHEGGRITELTARPLLKLLFPELAHIRQPLGGEYAVRRDVAEAVPFEVDYGVEIGLLIDIASAYGADAIVQAELGQRVHRNRPLHELREPAGQVVRALLTRAGVSITGAPAARPPVRTLSTRRS